MNTLLNALIRGGVFRVLRTLPLKVVVIIAIAALALVLLVSNGRAATYVTACPPASTVVTDTQAQCAALAERLEKNTLAIEQQSAADRAHTGYIVGAVAGTGFIVMLFTVAFGPRGSG